MQRLLILATLVSTAAFSASIGFQQDGWSLGGPLQVSFTGVDSNSDGSVTTEELTRFEASWETPTEGTTEWALPNIEPGGFLFTDPGNFLLFLRNPDYSLVSTAFEGEFLATVFDSQLFPVDTTTLPPQAVPEPGSLGVTGLALIVISARLRYRLTGFLRNSSGDNARFVKRAECMAPLK